MAKTKPTILQHAQKVTGKKPGPIGTKKLLTEFNTQYDLMLNLIDAIGNAAFNKPGKAYIKEPDDKYRWINKFVIKDKRKYLTPQQIKEFAQLPLADLLEMLYGC